MRWASPRRTMPGSTSGSDGRRCWSSPTSPAAQLCDAVLSQTAGELAETGLSPQKDYAFVVVGIDPRDDAADA